MRSYIACVGALCLYACVDEEPPRLAEDTQDIQQQQGTQLQGVQLVGTAGQTLKGFQLAGATLGGTALTNLHLEKGELVATQGGATVRGTALTGAHIVGQAVAGNTITPVDYQITAIVPEVAGYDPTQSGNTYLYSIAQNVNGTYQSACGTDQDGRQAAIPTSAIWDSGGNRVESTTLFTFACTTGAVAKCYRWGYRPWLTGLGDVVATHWACTRLTRADYCGTGQPHTQDGTTINLWDNLAVPINQRGTTPAGMSFEAGWNTGGALCLSHTRWMLDGPVLALGCPNRLVVPGVGRAGSVCDTISQAFGMSNRVLMFNESAFNVSLAL